MFQNPINTQQSDRSLPLILQPGFPGYNDLLKLAPCGIGLMCGKRQANVTDWLESITVAVSTDFVTDLVRWGGVDATMPEEAAERASFMNLLARHPDARLRAAAAGEPNLSTETVRRLVGDASHDVKNNLSLNAPAIACLTSDEAVAFAREDGQLIENTMDSMVDAAIQAKRNCAQQCSDRPRTVEELERINSIEKEIQTILEKARRLIAHFYDHPDLSVRQQTRLLQARLGDVDDDLPKRRMPIPRCRRSASAFGLDLYGRPEDYVYALVFLKKEEKTGAVIAISDAPKLMIPVDGLENVARELPANNETTPFVIRLANHPSRAVRSEVARRDALPTEAVEALCTDTTYDVRQALLGNEEILTELTDKDILNLIKGDPGLLNDAFGYGCASNRIARLLRETFGQSDDPFIAETLEGLE